MRAKTNDGLIHLLFELNAEFTLCGLAFEGDGHDRRDDEKDPLAWTTVKGGAVTCADCIRVIKSCRGVHTPNAGAEARSARAGEDA